MNQWCSELIRLQISIKNPQIKIEKLVKFAKKEFPDNGHFSISWLKKVLKKIDVLWYEGKLLKAITRAFGGLKFGIDNRELTVSAYILESPTEPLELLVNRALMQQLFQKGEHGYHVGGLLCQDRLTCFLHVLLHESVHMALTLCDKLGEHEDKQPHGRLFQKLTYDFFGHVDVKNGLIPGLSHTTDLTKIKERLKPGAKVKVYLNQNWVAGVVRKKGRSRAQVQVASDVYSVHMGLIQKY